MRTSIYILAFLLPLQGAIATCPDTLTPETLKQIQDRFENKATGSISIGPNNYIVSQPDTKYALDLMNSHKELTVEKNVRESEGSICSYTIKHNLVEGKVILVEQKKGGGSDGT